MADVLAALLPTLVVGGAFIALLVYAFRMTDGRNSKDGD